MKLREITEWFTRGYADARERTPYKRAPDLPESELCLVAEQAPPEARAYWDGFDSGVLEGVAMFVRARKRTSQRTLAK